MLKFIKNRKLRRLLKRLFIAAIIILVLIVILVIVSSALKSSYRKLYKASDELVLEQNYNNIFKEIDIDTKMTDIYITKSDDNIIKVKVYGEEDYIKLSEKSNKLLININDKNLIGFDFYSCISKVELYLPEGYGNLIRINSEFGNIKLDEFSNSTFYVEQEYGNILSLGLDFIRLENNYGDIDLQKAIKARVYAKTGDIKIGTISDLIVENEYGNIIIESVDEYLKLDNESGNIEIKNIVLEKDSSIESKYGDIEVNSINEIYINAKTDHGKVKIENNYKDSKIVLKINNENGDININ